MEVENTLVSLFVKDNCLSRDHVPLPCFREGATLHRLVNQSFSVWQIHSVHRWRH